MYQIALKNLPYIWDFSQVPVARDVVTTEQASVLFSGPKFFVALLAGVLMAFAFQLLFTNFSLAVGISGGGDALESDADTVGGKIRSVEAKIGLWALFTGSLSLFIASFLAVKLSLIESAALGAIIGAVIWSAYFTVIVWLGSTAIGSLIGSLISTVTSGFQGLMGTAGAALGANAAKKQMVSTAEEITAAVRRELTNGIDPDAIKNTLQSSLSSVELPKFDLSEIRKQFDKLLKDVDLESIADSDLLKNVNRDTFVNLISSRSDFSKEDINRIADQLQGAWEQAFNRPNPTQQVINLLSKATPEELNSEKLGDRLQELVAVASNGNGGKRSNGLVKQAATGLAGAVLDKVDVSKINVDNVTQQLQKLKDKVQDVDVDKITSQLQQLRDKATEQVVERLPIIPDNTIKEDIEEYIKYSLPWHFNRLTLKDEFREVIYDPNAEPGSVRRQLESLNQEYFTNLLRQRGDISEPRIKEISEQMDSVRAEIVEMVRPLEGREGGQSLRSQIENYLRSTGKEELNPEAIQQRFSGILEESASKLEDFRENVSHFNRETLTNILSQRQDISQEEANNIVNQLEHIRDDVTNRAQQLLEEARNRAAELRQRVEDYLRNTNKEELNPQGIERDFRTLLEDPQAGLYALRSRLSQFDRETLVAILSQRQDLSEEQVNQILDNLENVRESILQAPQKVADTAKQQYEKTVSAIASYLRNTNLEELDPKGIQTDLQKLLEDPKEGTLALRDRLSHVDRETLVKLLTQQGNLSEEQVNKAIDKVQEAIGGIVKAPQRFANRTVKRVLDFEGSLEDYLRNTHKEELNPEGIKRDLQLLLYDPRAGVGSLGDRISKFDRSTIVALLSQRGDISEEEANRIVEQIFSVRDSLSEQFRQVQQRVQSALDGVFGRIREYLNSLNRPELNYEGIQKDFAKLFDDPQAGLEALRFRLSQFDRGTLVALLSSREDISEEDANRIVNQIESARDTVLQRAELIQQETQKRLNAIKEEAKKQAKQSQKAVRDAAWWIFGTALTSLAASAVGGALAVAGFALFS